MRKLGRTVTRTVTLTMATTLVAGALATTAPAASASNHAKRFVDISAGSTQTCALTAAGAAKCWGTNSSGELGNGTNDKSNVPVQVKGLRKGVVQVGVGSYHGCALKDTGGVVCWGNGSRGKLGNNATDNSNTPVQVKGLKKGVTQLSVGVYHTCAILLNRRVVCWGQNEAGQLGDGTDAEAHTPIGVKIGRNVAQIVAGGNHTCAITRKGAATCWGGNSSGQLGDGTDDPSPTPVQVKKLKKGVRALALGWYYTCAIKGKRAKLLCWGWNFHGQLGDGTTDLRHVPGPVKRMKKGVTAVTGGDLHTCAVKGKGRAFCWGDNAVGRLGDGTEEPRRRPVRVKKLATGVTAIAAASDDSHTCAVKGKQGTAFCWGYNQYGQLGDGTDGNIRLRPVKVKL